MFQSEGTILTVSLSLQQQVPQIYTGTPFPSILHSSRGQKRGRYTPRPLLNPARRGNGLYSSLSSVHHREEEAACGGGEDQGTVSPWVKAWEETWVLCNSLGCHLFKPSVFLPPGVSTWAVTSRQRFLHVLQVERAQVCVHLRRNLLGNSCSGNRGTSWRRVPTQRTKVDVGSDVSQALTTQQEVLYYIVLTVDVCVLSGEAAVHV